MMNDEPHEQEFIQSLLSTTHHGNVNKLEKLLLTVQNPDKYLNKLYDETHMQKCTLLMIACLKRHKDIVFMILNCYSPNLEISNDIVFGDIIQSKKLFTGVSVLWAAASTNDFEIVKLLVEHGANVNYTTETKSTPLRGACYNGNVAMARYLIENGANVHIKKENNDSNLMVSVCHNHIGMVKYLVDELDCDVNECDNNGRSSLYDAVNCGSIELVQFLLKHGAQNFRAINDQMSPLMWAAEKRRADIVDSIIPICPLIERIEAEEILGSAFICGNQGFRFINKAYQHFKRALKLRITNNLPKPLYETANKLFEYRTECQTIDQLEQIRSDFNYLHIEGLLVRERLLGSTNAEYRYSVCYRGAVLADNGEYYRAIDYWMYELDVCQRNSIPYEPKQLRRFLSLFSQMLYKIESLPLDAAFKIAEILIENLDNDVANFDYNFHTLLFLITIITKFFVQKTVSFDNKSTFYQYLWAIQTKHHVTTRNRRSLLHLSLDDATLVDDFHIKRICRYPCVETVRVLLESGMPVNTYDTGRNTPLHIIVSNDSFNDLSILNLLFNAGAHLDFINISRKMPIELAKDPSIKQVLKIKMKMNLKCLCARKIQQNKIMFHGIIPTSLERFVEKH